MAKHGLATISTSTVGAGVRTCAADLPCARHQCVFDAAMAPAQESGLRENCTSRLSERAEAGRTLDLSRLYSWEADEQSRATGRGAGGAKGGGQGECEPAKHAPDSEPGKRVTRAGAHTAKRKKGKASPSNTQGGSRVPELGPLGSVRGALSNERPYRDLRNVVANYPFESSRGFPRSAPNFGHGDHSRLSCSAGDTQLGAGFCRDRQQALCKDVGQPRRREWSCRGVGWN